MTAQVHLYHDASMDEGVVVPLREGAVVVFSRPNPDRPERNEDSALVVELPSGAVVVAVADGVGGSRAGADASRIALECLASALGDAGAETRDPSGVILGAFDDANRAILDLGIGAGTTLVVTAIADRRARGYHAGDSQMLHVGQRGRVKQLTLSHSPIGYAVESGLLDEAEAIVHEDRHIISNLVGSSEMKIEIGTEVPVAARDSVLLASDGLYDNVEVDELIEIVRRGPLEKALARAIALATERMHSGDVASGDGPSASAETPSKKDDLTAILYRPRPTSRRT